MLFLSPGIVYWVQTLLHWCDSNAVFIVDVSRMLCKLFLKRWQETKSKRTHTAFLKIFRVVHEKKDKNALETGYQRFKRSPVSAYVWLNTNNLRNFDLFQDISCNEIVN